MENVKDEQKVYGKIAKVLSVKLEVNSLDHDFKKINYLNDSYILHQKMKSL